MELPTFVLYIVKRFSFQNAQIEIHGYDNLCGAYLLQLIKTMVTQRTVPQQGSRKIIYGQYSDDSALTPSFFGFENFFNGSQLS